MSLLLTNVTVWMECFTTDFGIGQIGKFSVCAMKNFAKKFTSSLQKIARMELDFCTAHFFLKYLADFIYLSQNSNLQSNFI